MSLEPFLRFLRAAQASSLTEPMPRRVSNSSFGVFPGGFLVQAGEDAGARGADEELTPSDFICVLSDFSELESLVSSANHLDKTCWRWSYFGIAFTVELILMTENYFYKIHKFLQKMQEGFFFLFNFYDPIL